MSGMVNVPVVTTLAMLEPETAPVSALPSTAALAAPPRKPPRPLIASLMKKLPPPARSSIVPNRTNRKTTVAETCSGTP